MRGGELGKRMLLGTSSVKVGSRVGRSRVARLLFGRLELRAELLDGLLARLGHVLDAVELHLMRVRVRIGTRMRIRVRVVVRTRVGIGVVVVVGVRVGVGVRITRPSSTCSASMSASEALPIVAMRFSSSAILSSASWSVPHRGTMRRRVQRRACAHAVVGTRRHSMTRGTVRAGVHGRACGGCSKAPSDGKGRWRGGGRSTPARRAAICAAAAQSRRPSC